MAESAVHRSPGAVVPIRSGRQGQHAAGAPADPASAVLEWAVGRSAAMWRAQWRPWLGPYLLLAAMAFVPLALDAALARTLQVQVHRIGGAGAGAAPLAPAAPVFDAAWILLTLLVGAGIARATTIAAARRAPVWAAVLAGVRDTAAGVAAWAAAGGVVAAGALALLRATSGGAGHGLVVGLTAALAAAAWAWMFWLVAASALAGPRHAGAAALWRASRGRRLGLVAAAALWAVSVGLIGMLAAAVSWSLGLWGGSAFYALTLAAVWLIAVRAAMLALAAGREGTAGEAMRAG